MITVGFKYCARSARDNHTVAGGVGLFHVNGELNERNGREGRGMI